MCMSSGENRKNKGINCAEKMKWNMGHFEPTFWWCQQNNSCFPLSNVHPTHTPYTIHSALVSKISLTREQVFSNAWPWFHFFLFNLDKHVLVCWVWSSFLLQTTETQSNLQQGGKLPKIWIMREILALPPPQNQIYIYRINNKNGNSTLLTSLNSASLLHPYI